MPQRPMLNLEKGKCYEISYHSTWRDQYPRKVKIIEPKYIHEDRIHSYGTIAPNGFSYIWDYGWEKETTVYAGQFYSIVAARELEGSELEEFETELRERRGRTLS